MASTAIEIFCCYSRKDQDLLENLTAHLAPLRKQGLIKVWNDTDISPGTNYEDEINAHLDSADIILLLVSPDFMNSDYCYSKEMERAMQRHNNAEARVIPIILRPVHFQDAPFGKIQALPTDAKPVRKWADIDDAFYDVAAGIKRIANDLLIEKYLAEARSLVVENKNEEALRVSDHAIKLNPNRDDIYWIKGNVLLGTGRFKEALDAYDKAEKIGLSPSIDLSSFYMNNGRAYEGLNDDPFDLEVALTFYHKAIEARPDYTIYYDRAIALLKRLKIYDEALKLYDQVIRLKPDETNYRLEKGRLLLDLKRYEDALAVFGPLLQIDPSISEAQKGKGIALTGLKRYPESLTALTEALKLNAEDALAHKTLGDVFFYLKRHEEALASYEQAIQLDANCAAAYTGKGDTLSRLLRYEDALEAYKQAIENNPDEPASYRGKAFAHERLSEQMHLKASQLFAKRFTLLHALKGHTSSVNSVALSADVLTIISGSGDTTIKVWDSRTGNEVRTLTGQMGPIYSVSSSLDGQTLVSGSLDKMIKIWDSRTGNEVRTLTGHTGLVWSVALSADGLTIISGSDDTTIKAWNVSTGQEVRTLTGHTDAVTSITLSADGYTLVSGSLDKMIKIWDLHTGQEVRTLTGHTDAVYSVALTPDGQTLASGSRDGTTIIWGQP